MFQSLHVLLTTTILCLPTSPFCNGGKPQTDDELQQTKNELEKSRKEVEELKRKYDALLAAAKKTKEANAKDLEGIVTDHRRERDELLASRRSVSTVIADALKDKEPSVRRWAAEALGNLGSAAKPHVPDLLNALKDQDKRVVEAATQSIRKLDPQAASKAGLKQH